MIALQGVTFVGRERTGRDVRILEDITVDAPTRRIAIIGPNGSGKSTLLKLIAGVLRPTVGRIQLETGLGSASQTLAYLPQNAADGLWLDLTIAETLRLAVNGGKLWPYIAHDTAVQRSLGWLPRVLKDRLSTRVANLSGGERQILQFAAALAFARRNSKSNPAAGIAADEFTAALDIRNVDYVRTVLTELLATALADRIFVFVTHSKTEMYSFADEVIALREGRLAFHERTATVTPAMLQQLYGE